MCNLRRTQWMVGVGLLCMLLACGDDNDANGNETENGSEAENGNEAGSELGSGGATENDAGIGGTTAGPDAGGGSTASQPKMLEADVAGRVCSNDDDCPSSGRCATSIDLAGPGSGFSFTSMPTDAPEGYCTLDCSSDDVCGAGGSCIGNLDAGFMAFPGICQAVCETDSDCREGYRCARSFDLSGSAGVDAGVPGAGGGFGAFEPDPPACAPIPETATLGAGIAGAECAEDADCTGGGRCLTATPGMMGIGGVTYPGGYCTGACLEDADCGDEGACVLPFVGQGAGNCIRACETDAVCREGYRCRDQGGGIRGCVLGDPPVAEDELGDACEPATADSTGSGCASRCATQTGAPPFGGVSFPNGYCSASCVGDNDCGGGLCLGDISIPGLPGLPGLCYKTCTEDADCGRDGYACLEYVDPIANFVGFPTSGEPPTVCQPGDD